MFHYILHGLQIESEIALSATPKSPNQDAEVTIRIAELPTLTLNNGERTEVTTYKDGLLYTWEDVGSFFIRGGKEIQVSPCNDAQSSLLGQGILGLSFSALLKQRGLLVLHANAVALSGRAILLIGEKGRGKSTLSAALQAAGHQLIADDLCAITLHENTAFVLPGSRTLKLWPDSAAAIGLDIGQLERLDRRAPKMLYHKDHSKNSKTPVPIAGIFILDCANTFSFKEIPAIDKILFLQASLHFYRCSKLLPQSLRQTELQLCSALLQNTPMQRFNRPWDIGQLNGAINSLEKRINSI